MPPYEHSDANQRHTAAAIERTAERGGSGSAQQAEPAEYYAPCRDGEYNNQSDLCAQWYAARSARDAADWAYWAVFWTVVSLGLSAVGLVALLVTIRQGREANNIARKTARRELRAYIGLDKCGIYPGEKEGVLLLNLVWKNYGQTPAYDVLTFAEFLHGDRGWRGEWRISHPEIGYTKVPLPPSANNNMLNIPIKVNELEAWRRGARDLFIFAEARYRDAFKRRRITTLRFVVKGDEPLELIREDIGNTMT